MRFSPKLGVRVDPWDNLVVFRSNYGEAFRAPTLNNLFGGSIIGSSRYKSNPNLKPELSKTWDVGVDVNPTDRLTLNVTGYKTWAEDYIANIPKGKEDGYNIKIKENIDKVTITGIEANIHYQYNEYLKLFAEGTRAAPGNPLRSQSGKPSAQCSHAQGEPWVYVLTSRLVYVAGQRHMVGPHLAGSDGQR